jgi:hypothetical protein
MPSRDARSASSSSRSTRRWVVGLVALVATAGALAAPAMGATTVDPSEDGGAGNPRVVRDSSVTVSVDRTAFSYNRSSASGTPTAVGGLLMPLQGCRGDDPAGTNASPRTTVKVKDPSGGTVLTALSPARVVGGGGLLTNPRYAPQANQTAVSSTNYRGDVSDSNAYHGMTATLDLTGKPAGVYTVETTHEHKVRTGSASTCQTARPAAATGSAIITGPEVTTSTFEYRPWNSKFVDVFGGGNILVNPDPGEVKINLGSKSTPIYGAADGAKITSYSLAGAGDVALPSDPEVCATDPASCVPKAAAKCEPGTGCTPRLVIVNKLGTEADANVVSGFFDVKTKAFIARVKVDGSSRLMMSLGTENDALYKGTLAKLSTAAAAQGIDLMSILATEVRVALSGNTTTLSLLNGLQIDPTTSHTGVQINSKSTVQAGILLHIYADLDLANPCAANAADSSTEPNRYTPNTGYGYTVSKSDLLPEVPAVGPLGAIVGGPIYHITGKFKSGVLVNTASAIIGADTAFDEPNGYPVWVEPFLSSPAHVATPTKLDFIGTATWSASESPVSTIGCITFDLLLGTGVAVFDNPLPVGFGTVFDQVDNPSPAAERLSDAVNDAVELVVGQASANPAVEGLLNQIVALLPTS